MKHTQHWLFDLDETLYPASCGLFPHVSRRITESVARVTGLPFDEARRLQREYWLRYGTSLRGLVIHHQIDPEPFLIYVHDVPVEEYVSPNPELRRCLQSLSGRRHIFTNSPCEYARRVLAALGLADLFENVFDIRHADYTPKPDPASFQRVLEALGASPHHCVLVDDAPQNLRAARSLGLGTVWLRAPESVAGGTAGGTVALGTEGDSPADLVIDRLEHLFEHLASR